MEASKNEMRDKKIILFDGVCHLCNSFVDFVIRHDQQRIIYFAPLQGRTAAQLLSAEQRSQLSSIIYLRNGDVLKKSDAILSLFIDLGGIYHLVSIFKLVPRNLRDRIYGWVAKNRYAWFGERDSCRLPSESEQGHLLP